MRFFNPYNTIEKIFEKTFVKDFSSLALKRSFALSLADLAAVTQNYKIFLAFTVETD